MLRLLFLRVVLFVCFLPLLYPPAAHAQQLQVVEAVCARDVKDFQPEGVLPCDKVPTGMSVVLWTRLQGDSTALEALAAGRPLYIVHGWKQGTPPWGEQQITMARSIQAGRIQPPVLEKLRLEVASRNYFDWRTWTRRDLGQSGTYRVWIGDFRDQPYPCGADRPAGCQHAVNFVWGAR